jgi:hypothetical protein
MSIGEVLSMYKDREIDVHPEFQRIFRWNEDQKSRLIESILLGIPIPTIFVAQREDGIWDVIDGVQRLSTILEFVGQYRDQEDRLVPPLALQPTEYLPDLGGYTWETNLQGTGRIFSESLRRDFKRSKLDFRIVKKESDPDAKFDLFQRLNSGSQLSAQESRNCLLVMLNPEFYRWMDDLSKNQSFVDTAVLSDRKEDEGFKQELVLRFFMQLEYSSATTELRQELGEYISDWVREAAVRDDSLEYWGSTFQATFRLLDDSLGEDTFKRWDPQKRRFLGPFSISAYEAITTGIGTHALEWEELGNDASSKIRNRVVALWTDDGFRSISGTGVSPRSRMPRLVQFAKDFFTP